MKSQENLERYTVFVHSQPALSAANLSTLQKELRRSVSELDIAGALRGNQRKRKLSRRKVIHHSFGVCFCLQPFLPFVAVLIQIAARWPDVLPESLRKYYSLTILYSANNSVLETPGSGCRYCSNGNPLSFFIKDSHRADEPTIQQLIRMLNGDFSERFARIIVVDCRYPYEYEGGHVLGAINLHDTDLIESAFPVERCDEENDKMQKPAIVFHCEFSSERGPKGYCTPKFCPMAHLTPVLLATDILGSWTVKSISTCTQSFIIHTSSYWKEATKNSLKKEG